jgi:hypothetical protein
MDVFKRLSFDIPGLTGVIQQYSGEDHIMNILKELSKAIDKKNVEESIYLLGIVKAWYSNNQSNIQNNEFVYNKKTHIEMEEKVKKYEEELKEYTPLPTLVSNKQTTAKRIFISHSGNDKNYCDAFVELLEEIGVPEQEILYSSSSRHGVPGDLSIFEYLRQHIADGTTVFYMLSDNYYQSPYCLNEMGAAWITQNDSSIFLLPNFNGKIRGVIDGTKKGYSLKEPVELYQLRDKIKAMFDLKPLSEGKWETIKNKFLKKVE